MRSRMIMTHCVRVLAEEDAGPLGDDRVNVMMRHLARQHDVGAGARDHCKQRKPHNESEQHVRHHSAICEVTTSNHLSRRRQRREQWCELETRQQR